MRSGDIQLHCQFHSQFAGKLCRSDLDLQTGQAFLVCETSPIPLYFAPPKYHAPYDANIAKPLLKKDDWDDLPEGAAKLM